MILINIIIILLPVFSIWLTMRYLNKKEIEETKRNIPPSRTIKIVSDKVNSTSRAIDTSTPYYPGINIWDDIPSGNKNNHSNNDNSSSDDLDFPCSDYGD